MCRWYRLIYICSQSNCKQKTGVTESEEQPRWCEEFRNGQGCKDRDQYNRPKRKEKRQKCTWRLCPQHDADRRRKKKDSRKSPSVQRETSHTRGKGRIDSREAYDTVGDRTAVVRRTRSEIWNKSTNASKVVPLIEKSTPRSDFRPDLTKMTISKSTTAECSSTGLPTRICQNRGEKHKRKGRDIT